MIKHPVGETFFFQLLNGEGGVVSVPKVGLDDAPEIRFKSI